MAWRTAAAAPERFAAEGRRGLAALPLSDAGPAVCAASSARPHADAAARARPHARAARGLPPTASALTKPDAERRPADTRRDKASRASCGPRGFSAGAKQKRRAVCGGCLLAAYGVAARAVAGPSRRQHAFEAGRRPSHARPTSAALASARRACGSAEAERALADGRPAAAARTLTVRPVREARERRAG
jgi:hypothetical protein